MRRFTFSSCAALLALAAGWTGAAQAQISYPFQPQYGPGYQTMLSPYLNMLRGGDPAANYFLGVLPEQQRRENRNVFQGQIGGLRALTAPLANPLEEALASPEPLLPKQLPPSGHSTAFGYTAAFFGGQPALPLGARRGALQQQQQQRPGGGPAPKQYKPLGR
jgi:hypothetical protein